MNTYDLCKYVQKRITTATAEVFSYVNWSDGFAVQQIREIPEKVLSTDGFEKINPLDLSADQMDDLGFGFWGEENPIRLIPLWILPFLVDEFEAGSIADDSVKLIKRDNIDNDHRFGCTAYGVIPKAS